MHQYRQGDHRAFEQLYLKHKGALYRYFLRQIGDQQLAEDLYQETWGRVIKAAAGYQSSAKFTTWLYRIAHNLLIDHVRALKPVESFTDDYGENVDAQSILPSDQDSPDRLALDDIKAKILKQCIALLPHVQKEAFLLSVEMGFTAGAISEIADVGLEATKSRIRYANRALKECVNSKWQE
ncbi:sigma-70 family RNA polymerase sigma factor [Shewanella psychrotolerans]|uniref:sigma-70 family RNA polymerase sigma factor n=1 Tax=Shewanella psychrotolerans TaxID=2864206 RepID=UPI001C65FCFE|nr:sigma-70 family RNA polymerase sigma factor [Shewanella psychrotolerans]QYK03228.1 sigma-70 family RNA polymerase sigma factor [Shewanella psychrotolerans]